MATKNIEIQDSTGNIYYPHTDASIVKFGDSNVNATLSDMVYQTAGGSSTAITLTIKGTLVTGYPITFIASANNGGVATKINGKSVYKPGTTTPPNFIKDKAYTVWYNLTGDCFFIKASAEGSALAKDVRKNTTFSNDNDTSVVGGLDLSLLVQGNIRAGVTIDGVTGKSSVVDTADAVLDPQYLLTGYSGYDDGILKVGTMPNNGAVNKSLPINGICTIPKGYHDGSGKVTQSIPTKAGAIINPSTSEQVIGGGQYITGDQIIAAIIGNATINDVIAGKVFSSANGVNLVGQATIESLGGRHFSSGTAQGSSDTKSFYYDYDDRTAGLHYITLPGLNFTPKFMIAYYISYYSSLTVVLPAGGDYSYSGATAKVFADFNLEDIGHFLSVKTDVFPESTMNGAYIIPVNRGVLYNWIAIG